MSRLVVVLKRGLNGRFCHNYKSRMLILSASNPVLSRRLKSDDTNKSGENDSSSSDDEAADKSPTKNLNPKQKAALDKLNSLLTSMKVNGPIPAESGTSRLLLQLSKPSKKLKDPKPEKTKAPIKELDADKTKTTQDDIKEREPSITPELLSAAKAAASSLGGNVEKSESEILQKLREHSQQTENGKLGKLMSNELIAGMKIDRSEKSVDASRIALSKFEMMGQRKPVETDASMRERFALKRRDHANATPRIRVKINLFGAGSLKIFTDKVTETEEKPVFPELKTWDKLEENNIKLLVTHPAVNAFEEMIRWTKEDKLWKFPINNEQGMDEEAKVPFHEHVFLEHLIQDGFPKKGPVRHFMELVITGLSKNPYMTVQEKHDHVNWFRNYFENKKEILQEIGIYN